MTQAGTDAVDERADRLRLVAGRLVRRVDLQFGHSVAATSEEWGYSDSSERSIGTDAKGVPVAYSDRRAASLGFRADMATLVDHAARRLRPARWWGGRLGLHVARGQALVEFAVVLLPILLIVSGIIQFGLLFGANVTLTNAAREGARAGTIYVYDHSHTKTWNDAARCGSMVTAATESFGLLATASPYFNATLTGGACPTPTGDTQANGDVTIAYCDHVTTPDGPCPNGSDPDTSCLPDTREACLVRITLTYRSDVIVPFIGALLSTDVNGRFVQRVTATMVVN